MSDPAPLITTPDAPVPPGGAAEWYFGAAGARLRAALFLPQTRARGSVILSPGRTEAIEKYYETIQDFLEREFAVLVHDWRGQGLSVRELPDRMKGHARGEKPFLDDFKALLDAYEARLPRPWIAVGHSMGGCLTLLAMAHGETRIGAAALSAPMLGINTGKTPEKRARQASRLQILLGGATRYVHGQGGPLIDDDFDTNVLTHDRGRFSRTLGLLAAEPQLALGAPTWGWLDFAFRATAYLARPDRLRTITQPVVIVQAEDDQLVDNAAQDAAARHLPQGKLIRVPGAYHEILMETDQMRNFFLRAFDSLTGRVAPKPVEGPKKAEPAQPAPPAAAKPVFQAAPKVEVKPEPAAQPAPVPVKAEAPAAPVKAAAPKAAPAKKAVAKKPAAKAKPVAKAKTAAKPAAKKPAAKAAAKPAAKAAAKPAAAKKPIANMPAAKKPVAKAAAKPAPKAAAAKAPTRTKAPLKAAAASVAAPKATVKKAPAKPTAKKPAAKKPAAKVAAKSAPKAVAKKPAVAAKKPAAPAKKPAPAKAAAAAAKKPAAVRKPATAAKKPAARKTA